MWLLTIVPPIPSHCLAQSRSLVTSVESMRSSTIHPSTHPFTHSFFHQSMSSSEGRDIYLCSEQGSVHSRYLILCGFRDWMFLPPYLRPNCRPEEHVQLKWGIQKLFRIYYSISPSYCLLPDVSLHRPFLSPGGGQFLRLPGMGETGQAPHHPAGGRLPEGL